MLCFNLNNQEQKKIRELKSEIERLKKQPPTEENKSRISALESQVKRLEHLLKAMNSMA